MASNVGQWYYAGEQSFPFFWQALAPRDEALATALHFSVLLGFTFNHMLDWANNGNSVLGSRHILAKYLLSKMSPSSHSYYQTCPELQVFHVLTKIPLQALDSEVIRTAGKQHSENWWKMETTSFWEKSCFRKWQQDSCAVYASVHGSELIA